MRYNSAIAILALELRTNYSYLRYNDYFEIRILILRRLKRDLYSYRNLYCDRYIR